MAGICRPFSRRYHSQGTRALAWFFRHVLLQGYRVMFSLHLSAAPNTQDGSLCSVHSVPSGQNHRRSCTVFRKHHADKTVSEQWRFHWPDLHFEVTTTLSHTKNNSPSQPPIQNLSHIKSHTHTLVHYVDYIVKVAAPPWTGLCFSVFVLVCFLVGLSSVLSIVHVCHLNPWSLIVDSPELWALLRTYWCSQ